MNFQGILLQNYETNRNVPGIALHSYH